MGGSFWEEVAPFRRALVVTGAGISASCGLPTYRRVGQSDWAEAALERISRANTYGNHLPELWRHWWSIIEPARAVDPSPAHLALARWQRELQAGGGEMLLVTQNIDGLHQRAGSDAIEFHGTALRARCLRCRSVFGTPAAPSDQSPAICPRCGSQRTRLDVVLFGEASSGSHRREVAHMLTRCDLLVMIGTSGHVWPVAGWPQSAPQATKILVNAENWNQDVFDRRWIGPADEILAQAGESTFP